MKPKPSIGARFERFHRDNPHVLVEIDRLARRLVDHGASRIALKQIFEVIRYDHTIATFGERLKLNNDYSSRYARLLIARRPDLEPYIETRTLKAR